jgi:hypothetical protein
MSGGTARRAFRNSLSAWEPWHFGRLAAYDAGPAPVRACGCVPPIPETQAYVADILGLLAGVGDPAGSGELTVRLVR